MWAKFNTLLARQMTAEVGFHDRRSKIGVRPSGRDFWKLYGVDMGIMRNRVFMRDRQHCQGCGKPLALAECELHHIVPRGKGGDDQIENLACICRACHHDRHVRVRWTAQEKVGA